MDLYIHTVGNDITKFNTYLLQIIDTLASWLEKLQDTPKNIFKGYGACTDKSFVEYIYINRNSTAKEKTQPPTNW